MESESITEPNDNSSPGRVDGRSRNGKTPDEMRELARLRIAKQADLAVPDDIDWSLFPHGASYSEEVDWVYLNFAFVVHRRGGKENLVKWGKRVSDPPSQRCRTLMESAAKNENQFFSGTVNKVMIGGADEATRHRHDRKLTDEIERSLELLEVK